MAQINYCGKTDIGYKRSNNEDTFVIKPELSFCAVADGMGGAAAGEVASSIFADTGIEIFSKASGKSEEETMELVQETFRLSNKRILDHVVKHPVHKGMGCTAEILTFSEDGFVIGHLGDSRTYRLRNGSFKQLTKDHSLIQAQMEQGIIKPEEAKNHPLRNVILRAVGIEESLALDLLRGKIVSKDIFLLCSDGLTDMVDDDKIKKILSSPITLSQKTDTLVQCAMSAGGSDNITVVLSEIG